MAGWHVLVLEQLGLSPNETGTGAAKLQRVGSKDGLQEAEEKRKEVGLPATGIPQVTLCPI